MEQKKTTTGNPDKSSTAFRTIGEVADELGLPPHVLRFWETKFSQIKPHKRRGGHRYYRPQDIELIYQIKTLLHDKGFTIKGAQKFLSKANKEEAQGDQTTLFEMPEEDISVGSAAKLSRMFNELCNIKEILNRA